MAGLSTLLIHADDGVSDHVTDVAPPINVSTTFRYDNDNLVLPEGDCDGYATEGAPVYSREGHPNSNRCGSILSHALNGYAVAYNSGLSAFGAALTHYNPKRLFIGQSYHGCHKLADIWVRNYGLLKLGLDEIEERAQPGDMVHIESPMNPYGTAVDIEEYVSKGHKKGAIVMIDSTFAPPPLQNAWEFGVDILMHSCTKYLGGHSDLLGGVLVVKDKAVFRQLVADRIYLGTNIANLDSYLLIRSLRTLELRVMKQSDTATKLVAYLKQHISEFSDVLSEIRHTSLQQEEFVKKQLAGGHTPVFSIMLKTVDQCRELPKKLKFFHHATSFGGVESLIEWRALSDPEIEKTLVRVSVGCEDHNDLINDLANALRYLQTQVTN
ncbi:putative cystathionine beta-lyase Ecym_5523 [Eremothecium cymbalariae DBVPG|uniref:Cystathionine gamma-synthase n=1 Tax=Eremothecium cymbalariae (strain CBS 270.75 / DBVPG 7215 / KCTC 17166 / NRRL Y-17582) TaxID=931890 RepID=I6NDX2_ERECY|nr:hypothetical protein Ecym_5523 [Eremothecium cymbalariae DBVPG\